MLVMYFCNIVPLKFINSGRLRITYWLCEESCWINLRCQLCAGEQQRLAGASIWGLTIILGLILSMNIAHLVLLSPWRNFQQVHAALVLMQVTVSLPLSLEPFVASVFWKTCLLSSGTTSVHAELEECVTRFVGKPAAVTFGMGYATNSLSFQSWLERYAMVFYILTWKPMLPLFWNPCVKSFF